jgi:hypothetical protein
MEATHDARAVRGDMGVTPGWRIITGDKTSPLMWFPFRAGAELIQNGLLDGEGRVTARGRAVAYGVPVPTPRAEPAEVVQPPAPARLPEPAQVVRLVPTASRPKDKRVLLEMLALAVRHTAQLQAKIAEVE